MVLVLGRRELSLRDLRECRSGFSSSIVVCICREDLHDNEPRSQGRQGVDKSRYRTVSEDGDDRLPPV